MTLILMTLKKFTSKFQTESRLQTTDVIALSNELMVAESSLFCCQWGHKLRFWGQLHFGLPPSKVWWVHCCSSTKSHVLAQSHDCFGKRVLLMWPAAANGWFIELGRPACKPSIRTPWSTVLCHNVKQQSTAVLTHTTHLRQRHPPVAQSALHVASLQSMLCGDHMLPPELGQHVKAGIPVAAITLDMEQAAAILGPDKHIAPLPVKHLHQALHLRSSRGTKLSDSS